MRTACSAAILALSTLLVGVSSVQAQTWTPLANQPSVGIANCLLLTDGGVICQSGIFTGHLPTGDWYKLTPDVTGSYLHGTWSQIASLPAGYAPQAYASAVLADGRVVLVGGEYDGSGNFVVSNNSTIYDPAVNAWTSFAPPSGWLYIGDAPSCVLPNGQFLIGNKLDTRLALLDPATLTWTGINPIGKSNGFNAEEGWTLLPDGSLLTVDVKNAPNTERFIPSTSTWVTAGNTPVDMHTPGSGDYVVAPGIIYTSPGEMGPALRRPDGTVFAVGGNGHTAIFTPPPANSTAPGTWVQGPDLPGGLHAEDAPAVLLPNGHVLAVGSEGPGLGFFEFDGANLTPVPANQNAKLDEATWTSLLLLPNGQVMLTDGSNTVEIYASAGTYDSSWAPTIGSVPAALTSGSTYQISGTQFNGLSQGSAFGDELQNATNYPLVRITNNASGHVFYAKTHGHSTMGIATGSALVSTNFDVSANIELGASMLAVVANGIPSAPVPVVITSTTPPAVTLACPAAAAAVGLLYNSTLTASGGQPPFTYSIVGGSLPPGLLLTPGSGAITGTPSATGAFSFTAMAVDSYTPAAGSTTTACTINTIGFGGSGGALVQSNATATLNPNTSSQSVGFSSNVTVGNTIFVFAQYYNAAVAATASDGCNDQFREITGSPATASGGAAHWFYARNVTGGNCTVTVTYSSPTSYGGVAIFEVSGLGGVNVALDQYASGSGNGSTASASITPTRANSFAIAQVWSGAGGGVLLGGSWNTQERTRFSTLYQSNMAGWQVASIPPVSLSTHVSTGPWIAMIANFYDSGGGGGGTVPITLATSPSGASLAFSVDGTSYTSSPQQFNWKPGDQHTIAITVNPQAGGTGTQYVFSNWSDGGAQSHTITVPSSAATYTANFTPQYRLTTSASAGGTISPAPPGVWLNAGVQSPQVQVTATANNGFQFTGFTGGLTGITNPQYLTTMNGPVSVAANFAVATPTFNPAAGPYTQPVAITTTTPGAAIRYTTDGSNPTSTIGTLYSSPVALSSTTTLKAIAYLSGYTDSSIGSATYTIGSGGPAGYWAFNTADLSGSTYLDLSGNAHNAVCTNVTSATGIAGQSAAFNGLSSYCQVPASTQLGLTTDVSLYAWIKTGNSSRYEAVLSNYDATASEHNYLLRTTPSGTLSLMIGGFNMASGQRFEALDQRKVNDGQWHQVAAVLQLGAGVTFYVDGVARPLIPANIKANSSLFPLQFGLNNWTPYGNYFTGTLDQVRIYGRALGASEVSALYAADSGGTQPPTVSITAPANNATVSGTISVTANASSSAGVASVQFQLDGANLGAAVTASPYAVNWNTTATQNGSHMLTAVATDTGGIKATSTAVTVTVSNPPPTVSITAPANNATVSGTISVTANAFSNVGVASVQFQLDGANLGAAVTASPYGVNWNTTAASNGSHALTAVATDTAGNKATATAVTVTVSNAPPTVSITAPNNNATVSGTIGVTASASSGLGVASVQFQLDGANLGAAVTASPYAVNWNTTATQNGSHTLTAVATDTAGSKATSTAVTVTVSNPPPTVSITAPSNNAMVSGAISVTASASSGVGVASVQFQLDGANLGAAVTASPYTVNWNTATSANGSHALTAVATDTAGNKTTSTAVTVTVSNTSGPAGFWTFDTSQTSGNTYLDSSGNGSNAVCTAPSSVSGVVNQAAHFNGTSTSCSVASDASMLLTNDLSLSVWVRTSNASRYEGVISTYDASGSEFNYLLRTTPSGTMSLRIGGANMANGHAFEALDQRKINDGKWHQLTAVMQIGVGVTFYVDGAGAPLVAASIAARANAFPLQFGINNWTPYGNYFTGDMDQLRIYSRALAASEVAALFSGDGGGTVPAPPTVSLTAPANNATVSGTITVSANASAGLGIANVQFLLDGANLGAAVTTAPYSVSWNTTSSFNGTHTLTAAATDTAGNTATSAAVTVTVSNSSGGPPPIPTGAVGYWSFDTADTSGNTYLDRSGNGSNAACTGVTSVAGTVNQAAHFNGTSGSCSVTADTSMLLTNNLSLSVWVRTTNSSRYEALLSTYDASDSEYNYLLRVRPTGTIGLLIGGHNVSTGRSFEAVDSRRINDGNWHHVAAVIQTGVGVIIYIDGVASPLLAANIVAHTRAAALQFGLNGWAPYGNYFTGDMDQARVYNRALTAAEVAALAQE